MGHCPTRGCITSISPCYTNIFKMFLWIKFIVRQRAETDNLPFTPCVLPKLAKCLWTRGSSFLHCGLPSFGHCFSDQHTLLRG